jgi:hypothetical protein
MTQADESELLTRDHILKLLSEGEVTRFSSTTTQTLRKGDEYLDLERLQLGVQRADGFTSNGHVLSRKAIQEDTWRRVLRQLKAANL